MKLKILLPILLATVFAIPAAGQVAGQRVVTLRTNLLYDAFLTPTLGVEWHFNPCTSLKVDGSFSFWGDETGDVQKIWLVSPEVRRYLDSGKNFYLGLGGNYGKYNVYGGMIGGMFPDKTGYDGYAGPVGYQGSLWNAGLTVGYCLPLSHRLSLDLNLGLGYTRFEYDRFNMIGGVRVYNGKDLTENFWGPTQAGVSLSWQIVK